MLLAKPLCNPPPHTHTLSKGCWQSPSVIPSPCHPNAAGGCETATPPSPSYTTAALQHQCASHHWVCIKSMPETRGAFNRLWGELAVKNQVVMHQPWLGSLREAEETLWWQYISGGGSAMDKEPWWVSHAGKSRVKWTGSCSHEELSQTLLWVTLKHDWGLLRSTQHDLIELEKSFRVKSNPWHSIVWQAAHSVIWWLQS